MIYFLKTVGEDLMIVEEDINKDHPQFAVTITELFGGKQSKIIISVA